MNILQDALSVMLSDESGSNLQHAPEFTSNGTKNPDDGYDGFDYVVVNVTPNLEQNVEFTTNGEKAPSEGYDGFGAITVAVPGPTLGTKTITTNNTYYALDDSLDGYSSVVVNVSGGANLETGVTFTTNGLKNPSYGYDGFGPVTVAVPSSGGNIIKPIVLNKYTVTAWAANTSYVYDDVVTYDGHTYQCQEANSDAEFTPAKWLQII